MTASWTELDISCAEPEPEYEFGRASPHGICFEDSGRERGNVQKGLEALVFEGKGGIVGESYCDIVVAMVVGET